MNQTLLRLRILRDAIASGDHEVIAVLYPKLSLIDHDAAIDEIVYQLAEKNYATAQQHIDSYLANPPKSLLVSKFDDEKTLKETFELYEVSESSEEQTVFSETDDYSADHRLEQLLELPSDAEEDTTLSTNDKEESTLFDRLTPFDSLDSVVVSPVAHIEQRFQNLLRQYPLREASDEEPAPEVLAWMERLRDDELTRRDIENMMQRARQAREDTNYTLSGQLILLGVATNELHPRHLLARELFEGIVFHQNRHEAVNMIRELAQNEAYPEAVCDLAQLYEHGIILPRNRRKAEQLYKEAMHAGITRAQQHYMRLHKKNRRLLSFLRR